VQDIEPVMKRQHTHQSHKTSDGQHIYYEMQRSITDFYKHFEIAEGGKSGSFSYDGPDGKKYTISFEVVSIKRLPGEPGENENLHDVELVIKVPKKLLEALRSAPPARKLLPKNNIGLPNLSGVLNLFSMQDILSVDTFDGYKKLCQWGDYHNRSVLCMLFWNMSPFTTDTKKLSKDTTFDPNDGIGTFVDIYSASHGHVFSGFKTNLFPPGGGDTVSLVSDQPVGGDTQIEFDANVYAKFVDPNGNAVQSPVAKIHMNWDPRSSPKCLNDSDGLQQNYCEGLGKGYDCNWVYAFSSNCKPPDKTEEQVKFWLHVTLPIAKSVAELACSLAGGEPEACGLPFELAQIGLDIYEIVEQLDYIWSTKYGLMLFMLSKTPQDPNNCYPPGSWCQTCKLKFLDFYRDPKTNVLWAQLYAYCKDENGNWHYTDQSAPYGYGPNGNGPCLYTNKHGFLDCDCDPPGDWCKTCAAYGYDKSNDTLWAYCHNFNGYLISGYISYSKLEHVSRCEYISNGGGQLKCLKERPCTPQCDGKQCGDDGCGSVCGACPVEASCVNNTCCVESSSCSYFDAGLLRTVTHCNISLCNKGVFCPDHCSYQGKVCKNNVCQ
jgi:hypothetical protein